MYKDENVHLSVILKNITFFWAIIKYHRRLIDDLRCNITLEYYMGVNNEGNLYMLI